MGGGGLHTETTWTETPWTETPVDRDPPRTETLPNEVWGKVMFLYVSVILSTGEGGLCMMSIPVHMGPGTEGISTFVSIFL